MAHKLYHTDATSTLSIRALSPHITTLSVPFARGGLIKIGARATLIRLPRSNSVAVFSPVTLTPEVKSTLASLGTVRYITATDIEHHIHLGAWHREYPDAKIIAPEGLPEKRKKQGNESVRFDVLGKAGEAKHVEGGGLGVDEEFDEEFDACYVPGHANRELVFCFKREKTLVEADLLFNLPATEQYSKGGGNPHQGLLTRLMCGINGTSGGAAKWQQRFIWVSDVVSLVFCGEKWWLICESSILAAAPTVPALIKAYRRLISGNLIESYPVMAM